MLPEEQLALRGCYVLLISSVHVHNIQPYLIQDGDVTVNDAEIIASKATSRDRMESLLLFLMNSDRPNVFQHLVEALKVDYDFLAEKLTESLKAIRRRNRALRRLPAVQSDPLPSPNETSRRSGQYYSKNPWRGSHRSLPPEVRLRELESSRNRPKGGLADWPIEGNQEHDPNGSCLTLVEPVYETTPHGRNGAAQLPAPPPSPMAPPRAASHPVHLPYLSLQHHGQAAGVGLDVLPEPRTRSPRPAHSPAHLPPFHHYGYDIADVRSSWNPETEQRQGMPHSRHPDDVIGYSDAYPPHPQAADPYPTGGWPPTAPRERFNSLPDIRRFDSGRYQFHACRQNIDYPESLGMTGMNDSHYEHGCGPQAHFPMCEMRTRSQGSDSDVVYDWSAMRNLAVSDRRRDGRLSTQSIDEVSEQNEHLPANSLRQPSGTEAAWSADTAEAGHASSPLHDRPGQMDANPAAEARSVPQADWTRRQPTTHSTQDGLECSMECTSGRVSSNPRSPTRLAARPAEGDDRLSSLPVAVIHPLHLPLKAKRSVLAGKLAPSESDLTVTFNYTHPLNEDEKFALIDKEEDKEFGFFIRPVRPTGFEVDDLESDGTATMCRALSKGDVIRCINGVDAESLEMSQAVDLVRKTQIQLTLKLKYEGRTKMRQENLTIPVIKNEVLGFKFVHGVDRPRFPQDSCFYVTKIVENTAAWRGGMSVGDVIVALEGESVVGLSYDRVQRLLRSAVETQDSVYMTIYRAEYTSPKL